MQIDDNEPIGDETLMTKDYANRRRLQAKAANRLELLHAPWLWFGVAAFLLVSYFSYQQWAGSREQIAISTQNDAAPVEDVITQVAEQEAPRFDFYTLLPNMAVEAPPQQLPDKETPIEKTVMSVAKAPVKTPSKSEATTTAPSPVKASYIVQAGSFKHNMQAEELRAMLTLNGFEASIQTVTMDNHEVWYRVYLGPFAARGSAVNTQQRLEASQAMNSLILKMQV